MTRFEKCWGIYTGKDLARAKVGVFIREKIWLEPKLGYLYGKRFGSSQNFSRINNPTFLKPVILHLPAYEDGTGSVPKRRHIKFRRQGITQKKAYIISYLVPALDKISDGSNSGTQRKLACHFVWRGGGYVIKLFAFLRILRPELRRKMLR